MTAGSMTPTPSLQRRVTLVVVALLAMLLVVLGVTIDVSLGVLARRNLHDRLLAATSRAEALAAARTSPDLLAAELNGGGVRALLVTADGATYGDRGISPDTVAGPMVPPPLRPRRLCAAAVRARPEFPAARHAAGPPPPPPPGAAPTGRQRHGRGAPAPGWLPGDPGRRHDANHAGDAPAASADDRGGRDNPAGRRAVIGGGSRVALRPLDRLTALANNITTGDRGRRLRPDRTGTELGRAARAFDGMLDALETSERRAQQAADAAQRAETATRRFLVDAAHELRTPIAGMQVAAEQLATTPPSSNATTTSHTVSIAGPACCCPTLAAPGGSSRTCSI